MRRQVEELQQELTAMRLGLSGQRAEDGQAADAIPEDPEDVGGRREVATEQEIPVASVGV